ncbi:MAG: hypothetical protein U1E78_03055 [Gammaproteobacteria bacterium]
MISKVTTFCLSMLFLSGCTSLKPAFDSTANYGAHVCYGHPYDEECKIVHGGQIAEAKSISSDKK